MFDIVVVESFEKASHMLLSRVGKVRFGNPSSTYIDEDELIELIENADAVVTTSRGRYTKRVLSAAKKLKIIAKCGALPNNVDLTAATENGLPVTWTPGSNAISVAEHTLLLMLAALKKMQESSYAIRDGRWHNEEMKAQELARKTIGIVGFGQVGNCLAKLLKPFDAHIVCYDPYVADEKIWAAGVQPVSIDYLLSESDIVSLHCHMCEETLHLMNEATLKKMKPTAYLINTGRGGLIDETALKTAISEKWIAGAALDVFETEPTSKENLLFGFANILTTPHMAGWTREALVREAQWASEEVIRVLNGEEPLYVANPEYKTNRR